MGVNILPHHEATTFPFNALVFIIFRQIHTSECVRVCASMSALKPQLFKVQVNLSWWLAVWSQEVASVRGREGVVGL